MRNLVIAFLLVAGLAAEADARGRWFRRGYARPTISRGYSRGGSQIPLAQARTRIAIEPAAQAWAEREAAILARNNSSGHPLGCCPGSTMSGTGMTSNPNCPTSQIPSCTPSSYGKTLIAEGVVRTRYGAFVSRHWR